MNTFSIRNKEFIKWARSYRGPKFHALFADSPYGLAFMGKDWDSPGGPAAYQAQAKQWGEAMLPILYPGALVFMFGGTRTSHRLTCGMEDAGFEMWDVMMWIHSQGFPKAQDIGGLVARLTGEEPVAKVPNPAFTFQKNSGQTSTGWKGVIPESKQLYANPFQGYKTPALKPAYEPILCFRAPRDGMTYAELALNFGTGALNVDGGRIPAEKPIPSHRMAKGGHGQTTGTFNEIYQAGDGGKYTQELGRYPTNVILDEETAKLLDAQSGVSKSRQDAGGQPKKDGDIYLHGMQSRNGNGHTDEGGASRFFYCAKASRSERESGCEALKKPFETNKPYGKGAAARKESNAAGTGNNHPCVKPLSLCRYLATLLLPPPSTAPRRILIPFAGSGSEMIGALQAGWDEVIGVEQNARYCRIAEKRIAFHQPASTTNHQQTSTTQPSINRVEVLSTFLYSGRKSWFVQHAAKYFRAHPCTTVIEPFAGSGVVGLSLLYAGMIERLVLVEKDPRIVRLLNGLLHDSDLADRYAAFECTHSTVKELAGIDESVFALLVRSRCSNRGKFDGGRRTAIDSRWCSALVVRNLRRTYALRDRVSVIQGDGLEAMRKYATDPNVGCFADPAYTADVKSKGHTLYRYHKLDHQKLFSMLASWRGPWLLTEDNTRMVRFLAACYRFTHKAIRTVTGENKIKKELMLWRKRRLL